jgi:ankyrin repeat protein
VDGENTYGDTPVILALCAGRVDIVRLLHGRGAELLENQQNGWNLIYYAAMGGDRECIKWVLDNTNFDINSDELSGETPICCALRLNHLDAGMLLVERSSFRPVLTAQFTKTWVLNFFSTPRI